MAEKKAKRGKKLLYFLQGMTGEERAGFREYLLSPLFANSRQFAELLDQSLKHAQAGAIDTAAVHAEMFPETAFDAKRAHYLHLRLAQLFGQLMDFLALQGFRRDAAAQPVYRLAEFSRRGWDRYLPETYKKARREQAQNGGAAALLMRFRTETILNENRAAAGDGDTHLPEVLESLDDLYFLEKLKYACANLNTKLLGQTPFPMKLTAEVLQLLEADADKVIPVTRAFAHAYRMLEAFTAGRPESETHFEKLFEILQKNPGLNPGEGLDLFTYAINYAILRFYAKDKKFLQHTIKLYDLLVRRGYLMEDGRMSPLHFKNIVLVMCRLGEFEWTEKFVHDHKGRIASDPEDLAFSYNLAVVSFYKKDYEGVIRLLYNRINDFEHALYGIGARVYLCRCLWEQAEWEWLQNVLNAFRLYLRRNEEITPVQRRQHTIFVRILRKIVQAETGNPDLRQAKLQKIGAGLEAADDREVFPWLRSILENAISRK